MPDITLSLIDPDNAARMDAAFALYRDNIEKTEQRTEEEFRALARRPDYTFVAASVANQMIGVAVSWTPPEGDMWLFEYAAVSPTMRGNGVGANLFFASRVVAGQSRMALIEIDADHGTEEQGKRIAFYRRLGCVKLRGLDYKLPLDAFGTPPPMWLIGLPPQATVSVSVHAVEGWLRRIYSEVYGKGLDDPRLAHMIDPLPDDVLLEAL